MDCTRLWPPDLYHGLDSGETFQKHLGKLIQNQVLKVGTRQRVDVPTGGQSLEAEQPTEEVQAQRSPPTKPAGSGKTKPHV